MPLLNENFPLLLLETASTWRNLLDKRLKPLGLSQAKWRTLLHLSIAKAPLTQTELAARLGIEGASLVSLLDGLAKAGWIERQDMPEDRRSKRVLLTDKAQQTLAHIHATANQLREQLLSAIPKHDLELCMRVLQKIKARAEEIA